MGATRVGFALLDGTGVFERYYDGRKQQHKSLTDWARQMIMQVRSWLPKRQLIVTADSSYATLELLAASQGLAEPVTIVTRLRLDAALYDPVPPRGARSAWRTTQERGTTTKLGGTRKRPDDGLD